MRLVVTLYFEDSVPDAARIALARDAVTGGNSLVFHHLSTVDWSRVLEVCRGASMYLRPSGYTFCPCDYDWKSAGTELIGAVLDADEDEWGECDNDADDFDGPIRVCGNDLQEGRSLILRRVPKGDVIHVGLYKVFSSRMVDALGGSASAGRDAVMVRGRPLTRWMRFRPPLSCSVISEESIQGPLACAICGATLIPTLGIWSGKSAEPIAFRCAQDSIVEDHRSHPIVISLDTAVDLIARFGLHGYSLQPIFSPDSATVRLARHVIKQIERLPAAKTKRSDIHPLRS